MTAATIQLIRTDAAPASDAIIVRVYAAEVAKQPRGAKARTARMCHCSHTHVTDVLREAEVIKPKAKAVFEPVVSLAYTSPPDAYPMPTPPTLPLCQVESATVVQQAAVIETVTAVALPCVSIAAPVAFETIDVRFGDTSAVPVGNDSIHQDAEDVLACALTVALLMTAAVVLIATKHTGLALSLGVLMLWCWWCVGGAARNARYWS